jgi:3-phenylpropionate/trans-cinnamate dioxygenase ferredoxin reductase subunit
MNGVVVVGAGQAGHQVAESLRDGGYDLPIVIAGYEQQLPYQRPPLSKAYLFAENEFADIALVAPCHYMDRGIEFLPGARAEKIDRARREVLLDSGRRLPYDNLVLATGARARMIAVPGTTLGGVYTLRSLSDAQQVRAHLGRTAVVVVIGAGFIGLEFATVATQLGHHVTVLETGSRIMRRNLSAETASFLTQRHTVGGVIIKTGVSVSQLTGRDGEVTGVRLRTGETLPADIVVVGIGVEPNDELAAEAGLVVDHGVVVNQFLRTSDPFISAIGDVARFQCEYSVESARVESVQNAVDQGRCAARNIAGSASRYDDVPWFWSEQAGHLLQIAGISTGHDSTCIRRSDDPHRFSTFCFRGDKLVAIESIGQPKIHMQARRLLRGGGSIPFDRINDPRVNVANEIEALTAVVSR